MHAGAEAHRASPPPRWRRLLALGAAVLLASAAVFGGTLAPATADASTPDAGTISAGPTDVAIPYLGSADITPAPPWRIVDCDAASAATPLVVSCEESAIGLAAEVFDPDAGTTLLPVSLSDGRRTLVFTYRVTLAAPEAPTLTLSQAPRAVAAGALLRVPLADLGARCTLCAEGGSVRLHAVDPAEAGTAWVTPSHVVFRAASGFRGRAEIQVWFGDDVGSESGVTIPVVVHEPGGDVDDPPLMALDIVLPIASAGEEQRIDLSALVTGGSEDARLVACGQALSGMVSCDADGTAHYLGEGGADQFGFQFGSGAERAFGSVTLVAAADFDDAGLRLAPMAPPAQEPDQPLATMFVPPQPRESGSAPKGAFVALVAALDRVGAR